jgi:hypothetical protein
LNDIKVDQIVTITNSDTDPFIAKLSYETPKVGERVRVAHILDGKDTGAGKTIYGVWNGNLFTFITKDNVAVLNKKKIPAWL